MRRKLLSFLALFSFFTTQAQLTTNYPSSNVVIQQATYTDLGTNGTVITTANNDDALSTAQPIGFTFTFNGVAYTDFIFCTNGYIKLGTVAPSSAALYYSAPNAPTSGGVFNSTNVLDQNMIVPLGYDLDANPTTEFRVYTSGAVGSRICTIQWKNMKDKNQTSFPTQYSNLEFQVKLYETSNIIEYIYGTWTGTANASVAKFAMCGLKGTSTAATELVTITKGSVTGWAAAIAQNGNYTGNALNFGNPPTRPAPVAGVTYKFIPTYPNDIGVTAVYTFGKLPKAYVTPHYIRAKVKNSGTLTQTNFKVYVNVTGGNVFSDSVVISTLAPGIDSFVTFIGYTPVNNGNDVITVSVPSDDNNFNQSKTYGQVVNDVIYSYADPLLPTAGGVGFTNGTGQFCAKFPYQGVTNAINQLGVNFAGGGVVLQVAIWGKNATTGLPGTLLWSSPSFTTVAGLNTVPVNPPVTITDTFFAGVLQTSTSNANFGYQNENPIRDKTFYYGGLNSTVWTDFAVSASNFRFMVEPRFQSPTDVGMVNVDYPCKIVPSGQAGFYPLASAFNYGLLSQTNVPVTMEIYDAFGVPVYSSTTSIASIAPNATEQVNFPNIFSPTIAGNYVIKTWTNLSGDASLINDTSASTLQVVNTSAITNAGNRVQYDGIDDHITVNNDPILNPSSAITVEAWVNLTSTTVTRAIISKDSSSAKLAYNLTVNTGGNPQFSVQTNTGVVTALSTTPIMAGTWTHLAATYDGTSINVYINGELTGTAAQNGFISGNLGQLFIGKTGGTTPNYMAGGIDEVKIWGGARTTAEIRENMHRRYPDFSEPNMLCNLHMDEGVGSFLLSDASGNCNNGTLVNMDVQNTTTAPAWFVSTIPFGTPVVSSQTVTTSGPVTFTGTYLTMNFSNYVGSETYVVHMLNTAPPGTQPTGVTATHPRTWVIYHYGTGAFTSADATYDLNAGSLPALASDVKLFNRPNGSGGTWSTFQNGATAINYSPASATFTYTSPTQFNQQFVVGFTNWPLPVNLVSFNAQADKNDAVIKWETSSEENIEEFEVERSLNASYFENIGKVKSKGNRNTFNEYSYTDINAGKVQTTLYYRLKMVDYNGKTNYSTVAKVQFGSFGKTSLKVQPNPFSDNLHISYTAKAEGLVKLTIINIQGAAVYQQEVMVKEGSNELFLEPGASLAKGVYMLRIADRQTIFSEKVIKN
jgi:hypothetical protein